MHAIADQLEPDNTVKTCFCHVALIVYLVYLGENKELFCSVLFFYSSLSISLNCQRMSTNT